MKEHDPSEDAPFADCDAHRSAVGESNAAQLRGSEVPAHEEASWRDEVAEAYVPSQDDWVIGADGLPTPLESPNGVETAIPFTYENVVCAVDDRTYVEMTPNEVDAELRRATSRFGVAGRIVSALIASAFCSTEFTLFGEERARRSYPRETVRKRFGVSYVFDRGPVFVRPVRLPCKHYRRQCWINEEQKNPESFGHKIFTRSCLARRSVGGAYLSVSNEGIYACEFRDPPDRGTMEKWIEGPDRKHLEEKLEMVPLWFGNK